MVPPKKLGCCPECGRQVGLVAGARAIDPTPGTRGNVQARPMEWQLHPCKHWVNSEQGGLISTGTTPAQTRAQREASSQSTLVAIDGARDGRQAVTEACKAGLIPESWLDEAMSEDFKREEEERLAEEESLKALAEVLGVTVEKMREYAHGVEWLEDGDVGGIVAEREALDKIIPKIKPGTGLVPGSIMANIIMRKKDANDRAIKKLREEMELSEIAKPRKRKIRRPK